MSRRTLTMYEAAGGEETFTRLIDHFYAGVAGDPVLRPLYPDDDEELARAAEHLRLFLIQYWGGPDWYNEQRGHPRLRLRHAPFPIGQAERDADLGRVNRRGLLVADTRGDARQAVVGHPDHDGDFHLYGPVEGFLGCAHRHHDHQLQHHDLTGAAHDNLSG